MSYNRYGGGGGGYQERKVSIQIYLNYILISNCVMSYDDSNCSNVKIFRNFVEELL